MDEDIRHNLLDSLSSESEVPDLQLIPPTKAKRKIKVKRPNIPKMSKLNISSSAGGHLNGALDYDHSFASGGSSDILIPRVWVGCLTCVLLSMIVGLAVLGWFTTILASEIKALQSIYGASLNSLTSGYNYSEAHFRLNASMNERVLHITDQLRAIETALDKHEMSINNVVHTLGEFNYDQLTTLGAEFTTMKQQFTYFQNFVKSHNSTPVSDASTENFDLSSQLDSLFRRIWTNSSHYFELYDNQLRNLTNEVKTLKFAIGSKKLADIPSTIQPSLLKVADTQIPQIDVPHGREEDLSGSSIEGMKSDTNLDKVIDKSRVSQDSKNLAHPRRKGDLDDSQEPGTDGDGEGRVDSRGPHIKP